MYVDETGAVRQALIGYSAGMDWDQAAIERAKQYHFQPAMLAGQPTSAWLSLPVTAVPKPQTCADFEMAVPMSAGVARFADSLVFDSPSQGRGYKYVSTMGFAYDVFLYPMDGRTDESEVESSIQAFRAGQVRGRPDSVAVSRRGRETVRTQGENPQRYTGHSAHLRLWSEAVARESYVAVFAAGDQFVKFRASYTPSREARAEVAEFVRQILTNQAWRARGCPRTD